MATKSSAPQLLGITVLALFTIFITWKAKSLDKRLHEGSDASAMVNKKLAVLALIVEPGVNAAHSHWQYIRIPLWILLPSTSLLSEERFLTITHASLKQATLLENLTTLCYGLDYALVFLLLAIWSFHYRSLTRD